MNARRLDAAPAIDWSVDSADGPVQGPLALAFLQGREVMLHLGHDQTALLTGDGRLRAVYGPGRHRLRVGGAPGGVDARGHLLFLCLGGGLGVRWTAAAPLRCGPRGEIELVGGAVLELGDAAAFHDAFLAGAEVIDPALVVTLADRLLSAAVAARLAGATALRGRPGGVRPEDLAAQLAPCGLVCRSLDIQAACGDIERDGARAAPACSPQQG